MRLLLTSEGIYNESIEKVFLDLVGKPVNEIKLAYVPTAVNMTAVDDKRWMVNAIVKLDKLAIGTIDFVDIAALPKEVWMSRFEKADVIYVEGGSARYLIDTMRSSGFADVLPELLKEKVYVGVSAGSVVLGEALVVTANAIKYGEGLKIVDFSFRAHFGRADRSIFTPEKVQELAKEMGTTYYAIDDNSAIVVTDNDIHVVSEGKWERFEK